VFLILVVGAEEHWRCAALRLTQRMFQSPGGDSEDFYLEIPTPGPIWPPTNAFQSPGGDSEDFYQP
jgi:hypothetical protein